MTQRHPRAQYTAADLALVRSVMESRHAGTDQAAPIDAIAAECGIAQRKVRAAMSDLDGVAFLLAENAAGRFLARTPDEAASMTGRLRSRAHDELKRLRRRRFFAAGMRLLPPMAQLPLFGTAA